MMLQIMAISSSLRELEENTRMFHDAILIVPCSAGVSGRSAISGGVLLAGDGEVS
jgi:hypothetical protein